MSDRIANAVCFVIAAGTCAMIAMGFGNTPHDNENHQAHHRQNTWEHVSHD